MYDNADAFRLHVTKLYCVTVLNALISAGLTVTVVTQQCITAVAVFFVFTNMMFVFFNG